MNKIKDQQCNGRWLSEHCRALEQQLGIAAAQTAMNRALYLWEHEKDSEAEWWACAAEVLCGGAMIEDPE